MTTTEPSPWDTNDEIVPGVSRYAATIAAQHAIEVQGGFSTPQVEAERIAADQTKTGEPFPLARFEAELTAARQARASARNDDPDTGLPIGRIRLYKELRERQNEKEEESAAIKAEADALRDELVEVFGECGVPNVNVDGKTVYLHRSTYAQRIEGVTPEELKAALLEVAPELVTETVNANTLSAYVREFLGDEDDIKPLPGRLGELLTLGERYDVRIKAGSRKAPKKRSS